MFKIIDKNTKHYLTTHKVWIIWTPEVQKSKTGVSVAPQKGLMSSFFFKKVWMIVFYVVFVLLVIYEKLL